MTVKPQDVGTSAPTETVALIDRRRAAEVLSASEALAWSVARFPEENPDPVLRLDGALAVLYANPAARELLKPLGIEVGRAAPAELASAASAALRLGSRLKTEVSCAGATFALSVVPVGDGEVNLYAQDITARKAGESALRESEERLALALQAARIGTWEYDPTTRMATWSPLCRELFGMPGTGAISYDGFISTVHVEDRAAVGGAVARALDPAGDGSYAAEFRVVWHDGSVRWMSALGRVWFDERAGVRLPTRMVGTVLDDTVQKEAALALREADRRKDEFLGMLSHELRNPLAPIRNAVYILRYAQPGSEQSARAQAVVERQAEHLTRLVDDLLDVTRIARGKIELRRSTVSLRDVVARAAEDFQLLFRSSEVAFHVDAGEEELWAQVDATRITQVIGNLLHNAAKFTRPRDEVRVVVRSQGGNAIISVRDTGAGVDAALLPSIFDAFVQGRRTLARTQGGLGLGLALVKGIIELHGGTVRVESAGEGRGAEFVLSLPVLASAGGHRLQPTPGARPAGTTRVLIVDDNADSAETLAEIAALRGHAVEIAYDGLSAIEKARRNTPDVVLCDIGLPGMSGLEVARSLRTFGAPTMRLYAISGYAQPEDVKRSLEAGFDGHLAKPADPAELVRLLGG